MKNKKSVVVVLVIIILIVIIGFIMLKGDKHYKADMMAHDHHHDEEHDHGTHAHVHDLREVDPTQPIPSVSIEAIKDAKDGYNIHITTTNFTLAPENINGEPTNNEGHLHLYVNGDKVARVYGNWFHLPASKLSTGHNVIEVTLNANNHDDWALNGVRISDSVEVSK